MTWDKRQHVRGPERVDAPGDTYQRFFAEWRWDEHDGRVGWVDFRMWEAIGWEMDGTPLFQSPDEDMRHPFRPMLECEPFMDGFRKFDGCTQWTWPAEMHHDSPELEALTAAIRRIHIIAADIMGKNWCGGEK